ncbi:E3 ISG15--protein ligase HERC5 [Symbiodinium microadriaticum]|uniref:E3 ISG15--protein ligase HERC5 n=1 Tax=Symbiodinium microadriaticum TaxID=2951 RepID=A0A1Q9CP67_SYMMI|nr:E3 ISG15--protein ligase HERC5 [Symbiodinium microadriaticum]
MKVRTSSLPTLLCPWAAVSMASLLAQTLEQQLRGIPVLAVGTTCPGGFTVIESILHWLANGVRQPVCIFNSGNAAAFIGKDGRLYTLRTVLNEDGPSEPRSELRLDAAKSDSQDWQLTDTPDVAAVTVAHTERCILVLDSKMELHVRQDDGTVQDSCLTEEVVSVVPGERALVEAALPRPLAGRRVAQVACSDKHFLALTSDGVVHSCGSNTSGQLGLGHTDFILKLSPISLDKNGMNRFAIFVACGSEHSAVLCEQGTAITFGSSHDFRLGRSPAGLGHQCAAAMQITSAVLLVFGFACRAVLADEAETELPEEKLPQAPFGAKTEVYFPFRDYTVEEWLDWIYHLQTNHVLLTPEYAAYVCEVARLLGMPSTEHEDPQSIHVCCMGPGSYLVKWFVDSRKLPSNDKQVIPPGFDLYHHGAGQLLTFLIGAFPKNWGTANPDANFKNSDGRGVFQLKCDTQPKDRSCLPCRFGFSVSNGEMRTASGHFTLNNCVVELPEEESAFHLFGGAGPDQLVEVNALVELF